MKKHMHKAIREEQALRAKAGLVSRLWVRFHMTLILIGVFSSGIALSKLLGWLGLGSMALRYTLAALVGYGVFFVGVRLWLWYSTERSPFEDSPILVDVAREMPGVSTDLVSVLSSNSAGLATRKPLGDVEVPLDASSDGSVVVEVVGGLGFDEGAAVVIAIAALMALVAGLLGASVYLVIEAPVILSEAAFQILLAATLRQRARTLDATGWSGSVFKATWKPALAAVLSALFAGVALDLAFPQADTAIEVWQAILQASAAAA